MKLRYISLLLFQICAFSLFAMFPEEKTTFKGQLKAAKTSAEMEQVMKGYLKPGQSVCLYIVNANETSIYFTVKEVQTVFSGGHVIGSNVTEAAQDSIASSFGPRIADIVSALRETFFEEMHPFIYTFGRVDVDAEAAKFARYEWANKDVVERVTGIFGAKVVHEIGTPANNGATDPAYLQHQFRYVKNEIGKLMGENDLFGVRTAKYTLGGILAVALLGGIYYYCFSKSDEQDEEETKADQEAIENDAVQDASASSR